MKKLVLLISLFFCLSLFSQEESSFKWWNPAEEEKSLIEGRIWDTELEAPYDRLPRKAKGVVRDAVWNLSKHSAGLMIRFRSNAEKIIVRYKVKGNHAMQHMPATGVSGVDLYAIDSDGNWLWCNGRRSFGEQISFTFSGINPNDNYHERGREYRLYLPLYNQVEWMEIGVEDEAYFQPLPLRMEKPILVYGTSIAQGACASRPGMAWTSILGRKLDRPLINLAFSGNGRLEEELIDLLLEVDPKIYILDCLPNLWNAQTYDDAELSKRILRSVRSLKEAKPHTPILLVEHAGYTDGLAMPAREKAYSRVNDLQEKAFAQLKAEGYTDLHYLTYEEIGLGLDAMVDGTHPNDLGMMQYARAYEKKLRQILDEPLGQASTTQACIQYREPDNYDWENRHRDILKMNRENPPKTVFLANSIVHFWGGLPRTKLVREEDSWENTFTPMGVRNFAYGWDRIENVLWRVYHDELDGFEAENILLMIGTNNLHLNSDEEILEGLDLLIKAIQIRQPKARLRLMGLLPRRAYEARIASLNLTLSQLAADNHIDYADIGNIFLLENLNIDESLFSDGLHPNAAGYVKMREAILPFLDTKN